MAKFNTQSSITNKTENLAGGEAYKITPEFELVSILLTSFIQDQYYRSEKDILKRLRELMGEVKDKKFIAKTAIYARTEYGMRSVSHVIAGELAKHIGGNEWAKDFYNKVIFRPDDILEILAYYASIQSKKTLKPISNALRKGIRMALSKFDEYQLAKYRGEAKDIKLIDVVNLLRPTPSDKNAEALTKLVKDTLRSISTRESVMSATGQGKTDDEKAEAKKEAWESLISEEKIGYFALLKNLRNIILQAPEMVDKAVELLTNEERIKKSLVLPFRYMSAIQEVEKVTEADQLYIRKVLVGLNKAVDISVGNTPKFDGRSLVVVDHSGSMDSIEHGNISNFQIGALFGAILAKTNNADFMHFGDSAEYLNFTPTDSTLSIVKWLGSLNGGGYWGDIETSGHYVGHGTNFHSIFQMANKVYDRIIIFSDMQAWVNYRTPKESLATYMKQYNCNPHIYTVDLAGNGSAQFPQNNVYALTGFSDKIFDIMKLLESDRQALINKINSIEL